ncbi:HD domain-containing phosphohydrolase [uncultured Aquabacterium sp.]|jgi:putative two-component system response regulator|uniref:HD-GYP domain-containing protein n=1 Tax=uncultured Aquabacterium sp. TaxID=158753 RepID=UPI00263976C6|nr:HD domain-containing phosphohydrolase [uncultured Aquabacterium sp.]
MTQRHAILVIDDSAEDRALIQAALRPHHDVVCADTGERGLALATTAPPPDLILLDILMPGMDGHAVCQRLKTDARTRDVPVILLSTGSTAEEEGVGLERGAADHLAKPLNVPTLLARVRTHLALHAAATFLHDREAYLEQEVVRRTRSLSLAQDVAIMSLTSLAETRDADTGNHIRRTQNYVRALARKLSSHPRYAAELNSARVELIFKAAPLHDIGKVAIPDRVLLKRGKLEPDEFEIMKRHAVLGRDAIAQAASLLGSDAPFLEVAQQIAHAHHEKWDGSGYPQGLRGDAIPLPARLMAVADVYDALISRRVYKDAMPHEQALEILRLSAGRHFDPDVVQAFLDIEDTIHTIALTYADSDADLARKRAYLSEAQPES